VWPGNVDYGVDLTNAHDLAEYDALIVQPTFRWLVGTGPDWFAGSLPEFANPPLFRKRRAQLLSLLRRGGVVLAFLGPLSF